MPGTGITLASGTARRVLAGATGCGLGFAVKPGLTADGLLPSVAWRVTSALREAACHRLGRPPGPVGTRGWRL